MNFLIINNNLLIICSFISYNTCIVNDSVLVSEKKFDNQVIPRLIWFSSLTSLRLILINRFLT